jgi:SAM-dependent methyltransferase
MAWWRTYFDEGYLNEFSPLFTPASDRAQVARLLELLELPAGARLLDLACGQGRHAALLAVAGHQVAGVDLSRPLLRVARTSARAEGIPSSQRRGASGPALRYHHGDMRRLPTLWRGRFDAVVNLFTSFGFFDDPADDVRVSRGVARVLKRGGTFIWQGGSRDGIMARFVGTDSWETADGTAVRQDRSFDSLTGFLTIQSTWTRRRKVERRSHRIRLYTADRLAQMMEEAGLTVTAAYDGFTDVPLHRRATEMLLVARKAG